MSRSTIALDRRVPAWLLAVLALAAPILASEPRDLTSRTARKAPEWVTHGVIYQVQARAFTAEGTLKAATAQLPKVAEIGVNIVYLWPVFVSDDDPDSKGWSPRQRASKLNNPRNPYRMKDYYHVDPEYGTDADLQSFIAEAHRLGMRVLLDMVFLHCGPTFAEEHPQLIKRDAQGKIITTPWGFPTLDFAKMEVREFFWKNMEYWAEEFGADGFRCDVSDSIPLDFWKTARERLENIQPDICLLAEGNRYADQLEAFDLNYCFPWMKAIHRVCEQKEPVSHLRRTWQSLVVKYPRGARLIRFIDNHDIANDAWHNRLDKKWGTRRVDAALVLHFTIDGVPFLYNGQEIADTARHSIYGRLPIDWSRAETPTGKARFAFCQKLCALRRAERALTQGGLIWLDNDQPDSVASFLRRTDREEILSVVNLSNRPVKVRVTMSEKTAASYSNLLAEGHAGSTPNGLTLNLESCGFFVGKRQELCADNTRG